MSVTSRYMQELHDLHWKEEKCILNYVQGTREFGIHYSATAQLDMIGFTNSYWVGDNTDMKSTSRFVFMLGYRLMCCSTKKKTSLCLSSTKSKYRGVVNVAI